MKRYALRVGEPLAIDSASIRHDADGFYMIIGDAAPENETRGTVTIVNVRGALCQYKGDGGDSYEGIVERVSLAIEADPKPEKVLMRIDSPGGVVAGLNECVGKLQSMSKAAKVPLIAYVPSMAASAAFAICCACVEVLAHESAIVGSVGVISTMVSMAERDAAEGVTFRLITSGKRKADGHLHAPISNDAEKAEKVRNDELARQFFAIASKARGLSPAKIEGYEAGIFLGNAARKAGLIDDVSTLDQVLYGMGAAVSEGDPPAPNGGNVTDRRARETTDAVHKPLDATHPTRSVNRNEAAMSVKLSALIRRTEAAIASEADPKALRGLQAKLAAYTATRAEMDDGDDDDDKDKPDGDGDGDDSKAKKAAEEAVKAKKAAEAAKHRSKAAEHKQKMEEAEEEAKKCEETEEETAARLSVPVTSAAASTDGGGALGVAMAELARTVGELKATKDADARSALISKARPYIPPHMIKAVSGLSLADLSAFVTEATKGEPIVFTAEGELYRPRSAQAGTEASLPPDTIKMIDDACAAVNVADPKKFRAALVETHIKAHSEAMKRANDGAVRY